MTAPTNDPRRPRLSVAMIVRDEQDVLAETIESVRPIADEIVVLDTGSSDQTPAVAERLGATVVRAAWTDDFSAARNGCLEQTSGDWVLWLDAGERLAIESVPELRRFIDRHPDPKKVYLLMIEVPSLDTAGSNEQVAQMRLFARNAGLRFEGRVREFPCRPGESGRLKTDIAPGRILQHPRQHDPEIKARKARRNLRLVELETAGKNTPPRLLLAMGEAHANLNNQQQAQKAFRQVIESSQVGSTEMLEAYYGLLTTYDGQPQLAQQQRAVCLEALEAFPLDAQLLLAMGNYMQSREQIELATRTFQTAVKHGQIDLQTWHLTEVAEVAAVCVSLGLQLQNKDDEAVEALEEALDRHENSARIRRRLIDLHIKHGRVDKAIRLVDALPMDREWQEPFCNVIRGAVKAIERDWLPALGYLQSAYAAGCRDPLCLRWLSLTLLSNGWIEDAKPVLTQWSEVEPGNAEVQAYLAAVAKPAEATAQDKTVGDASCRMRIDPGTTVLEAGPTQMPIIGQASTSDS